MAEAEIPDLSAFAREMPWLNREASNEERAESLLAAMDTDQLIHMLHGASNLFGKRADDGGPQSIGYIPPIPELRVPALVMSDGPSGLRNREKATGFPAPITQAASFDPEIAREVGAQIAREAAARGQDQLFGPAFNLARVPIGGRTFEYYGEDPLLAGTIAAANAQGIQNEGVMATLKHYVANNHERQRNWVSANLDERTLHEIYERPFRIAIEAANPASVMSAYNKINGIYACSNRKTQVTDLRERMGFTGFVVSDYPATHEPTDIKNGLNVELPKAKHTTRHKIEEAIKAGHMTWEDVRARVRETLIQMFRFGLFDHPWDEARGDRLRQTMPLDPEPGYQIAQKTLEAGAVLLKNDGILPLDDNPDLWQHKKVLIIGKGAQSPAAGGGSSKVDPLKTDDFLTEFSARVPDNTRIVFKPTWDLRGIKKEAPGAAMIIIFATQRSTEILDRRNLSFSFATNKAINTAIEANDPHTAFTIDRMAAGPAATYGTYTGAPQGPTLATAADTGRITPDGTGSSLAPIIVVTQVPGAMFMPWRREVNAILNTWYPGEASAAATTRLLFGDVNPSGRLPLTFPKYDEQSPIKTKRQYPGDNFGLQCYYDERIFIGYRWYLRNRQKPTFPFGFGLSYTEFSYRDLTLSHQTISFDSPDAGLSVTFTVENIGEVAGACVPQIYVGKPEDDRLATPPYELAGYTKEFLEPGEKREVTIEIPSERLEIFDPKLGDGFGDFVVRPGDYRILLADSTLDIKEEATYTVIEEELLG